MSTGASEPRGGNQGSAKSKEFMARAQVASELVSRVPPPGWRDAPVLRQDDFVSGHLSSSYEFWADVVLLRHPQRDTLLRWLQGLSILEFVDPEARGTYEGRAYSSMRLTPREFPNQVSPEHEGWVDAQIAKLVEQGSLERWADVADASFDPRPCMSLPLRVDAGQATPRLVWDGRWLNLMCRRVPFQLGGVAEVAQLSWPGAYQTIVRHESGFHQIPLNPDSWKYFGLKWRGDYYVWTVLCSGWCLSPYVYHTLSDAVAQFLRSRDVPALACIDELWVGTLPWARDHPPEKQAEAAGVAAYIALAVLFHCGYFLSLSKCELEPSTRVAFSGVTCDTAQCRFEVPEDRLAEMEASLGRGT